jgi:uridine phosphorylase
MQPIAESELVINSRGAVYHLDIHPDELAPFVITVGDPSRVSEVSKHFDQIECRNQHREFISHTGRLGKKRITVLSSGIGPDNIDIVMNELDALANIDFKTRTIRPSLTSLRIMRVGTSGSLQADIPVDSFVASTHGLGIDNLMNFYRYDPNEEERELLQAFITQTQLTANITIPYVHRAGTSMLKYFANGYHQGITVTCPGFYGPQGRVLRVGLRSPQLVERLTQFHYGQYRITNFEMETSAIYGLGRLMGHHCVSVNAIIANRVAKQYTADIKTTVDRLITKTLGVIDGMPL